MSGGVDSSVAAALLFEAGHDVVGVTMQLLPEGEAPGQCCGDDAVRSAKRVCDALGIPHYVMNSRDVFQREVIDPFVAEYARGRTPNPCIVCNDAVKFADLLARVSAQGADALATGHYARIVRDEDGTQWLERGIDRDKDQSYFLYRLGPPAIDRVLFPVGEMRKTEVREKAAALGLQTAERADSQEICFVPPGATAAFVGAAEPRAIQPGELVDASGTVLGMHRGIAHYTVGQRKGIGLAATEPLYVTGIDPAANRVIVGARRELERRSVRATDAVWRLDDDEARVEVQTRYRMEPVAGTAGHDGGIISISLDAPVSGIAPGQAVVCYQGTRIVGGGVVSEAG